MATTLDLPDQEPPGVAAAPGPEPAKSRSGRRALSSLRRELSDKELLAPAVQKLLVDEIERLEEENGGLATFRGRFHEADKKAAVLEQNGKASVAYEIISLTCITVGGAALGYAPAVWTAQPSGYIALGFGAILVAGGVAAKAIKA